MMVEDRKPFARSVRRPVPDAPLPPGVDYADEMEPPPSYGSAVRSFNTDEADRRARLERMSAPPTPKPVVTGEERDRMVSACGDAILGQAALIHGAGDVLIRALAERLGIAVEDAERLIDSEIRRRATGKK